MADSKIAEVKQQTESPAHDVSAMTSEDISRITGELLERCRAWILRYVVVTADQALILSAWILHTYAFDTAENTPYIHITAPTRECGKSRLMEVLEAIAASPIRSGGMTPAALVRTIEVKRPTIFLDEMDAQLGGNKEYAETIRGILNEGFHKGGRYHKCMGKDFDLKEFNVFCPKCFAGIGRLPDTVSSRSIVIEMRRKLPTEAVDAFRQREVNNAALPIRNALRTWIAGGATDLLMQIKPEPISALSDRQNDIAELLLSIAELAGIEHLRMLKAALCVVFKAVGAEDGSLGEMLLSDLRTIFDDLGREGISSNELVTKLCEMEGHPWAEWSHKSGFSPHALAQQLRAFGIVPGTIRVGSHTPKGYRRADFEDAWARYCPLSEVSTATPPQTAPPLPESEQSNRNTSPDVAASIWPSNRRRY